MSENQNSEVPSQPEPLSPMLTIGTEPPPIAYVNEDYRWTATSDGGEPDTARKFSVVGGLPPDGMVFTPDGTVSGIGTSVGETTVTISVFDGVASVSHPYLFRVQARPKLSLAERLSPEDLAFHKLLESYVELMKDPEHDPVTACVLFCRVVARLIAHPSDYVVSSLYEMFEENATTFLTERSAMQGFGSRGPQWSSEEHTARVVYAYFRSLTTGTKSAMLTDTLLSVTKRPEIVNFFRKKPA